MNPGVQPADGNPHPPGGDGRRDNGLAAESYVPIAEAEPGLGDLLLAALARARIAAYLDRLPNTTRLRLYVAGAERSDASTIVAAVARAYSLAAAEAESAPATGEADAHDSPPDLDDDATPPSDERAPTQPLAPPDLLAGRDTNAEFSALIADWHVDTVAAIRSAERDLNQEDSDWRARIAPVPPVSEEDPAAGDDEEHYVPPAPPPLPRLAGPTILALLIVMASIAILAFGGAFGLGGNFGFLLGIGGILVGAGLLVMRLRERPDEDEDDDGAIL